MSSDSGSGDLWPEEVEVGERGEESQEVRTEQELTCKRKLGPG